MDVLFTEKGINDLLNVIKDYIVYVYPGFITLIIYRFIIARKVDENQYTLIKSIIISYIYVIILAGVTKTSTSHFTIIYHIVLLIISCIVFSYSCLISPTNFPAQSCNCIFKSQKFIKILRKLKIDTDVYDNMLDSIRAIEKEVWIRVYLDSYGIMYEGSLRKHEVDSGKAKQIVLSGYRFYIIDPNNKEKKCILDYANKNENWVKISEKNITRMEIVYSNPH